VYAELTVRENLIFAGRFKLPKGTPDYEIEELADATLANLGLSRVSDSPVGDIRRRGVSGGEKKRVNIGLELMARPSVLFLDEPTSGLVSCCCCYIDMFLFCFLIANPCYCLVPHPIRTHRLHCW
jgi:ABC-type multidrug transport system ATPase subunit